MSQPHEPGLPVRGRYVRRRRAFASLLPDVVAADGGEAMSIERIYELIEQHAGDHLDDERDPSKPSRPYWKKQLQWELKTAVTEGRILKRSDLGRGVYGRRPDWLTQGGIGSALLATYREAPLEQIRVEGMHAVSRDETRIRRRREAVLVHRWATWCAEQGRSIDRIEIRSSTGRRLVIDAYDATLRLVVEAKASVTPDDIRMAVGQLADYSHHLPGLPHTTAVLLPESPPADLAGLLAARGVGLIYPCPDGFSEALFD